MTQRDHSSELLNLHFPQITLRTVVGISQTPNPWEVLYPPRSSGMGEFQPGMAAGNDEEHWEFFFLEALLSRYFAPKP